MKKFILSATLLLITYCSFSQTYGNEWIDYTQSYYKFPISQNGIYKIDYNALVAAGVPTSTFSTKNMQVFGRQKEVPIYVIDGGDQSFDAGDYFLFYATKNDGWLDSTLYVDPNGIGNPSYSLYNDTINYFFTWNNQTNNKRFTYESFNVTDVATAAPYWLYKIEQSYNNSYIECKDINNSSSSSYFLSGEGWSTNPVNGIAGYTLDIPVSTFSPYTTLGAPPVKFQGISVSNSNAFSTGPNHDFSWTVGNANLLLYTEQYEGYQQKNVVTTFPANVLGNGYTPLKWSINASSDYLTDFQSLSYWSMIYPKQTTLNGLNKDRFFIRNNAGNTKIRLDITNTTLVNPIMMVFGGVPKLVALTNSGTGIWHAIVTNASSGIDQEVILQDESTVLSVTGITPVSPSAKFTNFSAYANATNVVIMVYHPSLQTSTGQYASYRSSAEGGSYNVVLANVNELYLQYGGGIPKHVLGIRRFAHEFYNNALIEKPKALFLMGKGIREANESNSGVSPGTRKNATSYNLSLIPSYGYPSSDILITAGLDTSVATLWEPLIPTGRIAVQSNEELADYLQKVKEFDLQQDQQDTYNSASKEWQKQILHFAGGTTALEQDEFQSALDTMRRTIEGTYFGGNVTTFIKTTSDPLDPTAVAEVSDRIESGVSIMNFFGHASVDGFEINVDDPTNWDNQGKYPLVIGNACFTGDMYQNYSSTSEQFVLLPEEGAIAFLSSVKTGFGFSLERYTGELYRQISLENYGLFLSHQIKETIHDVYTDWGDNIYMETTCTQMALHGDPLLRVNWHGRPEIDITEQAMFFLPEDINLTVDSIEVNVILTNLGQSVVDTFTVEVTRNFPNNVDSIYYFTIPGLNYKDTLSFKIPLQPNIGVGINRFTVEADIPSIVAEYEDFTNNRIENKPLIINIDGIVPVIPYEFAVVPNDSVTVKASTIDPIADFNTYRFEIDTTDLFNSPQKRYAVVSGLGGVKEVNPSQWKSASSNQVFPLVCTDSTVYFWRVAVDSSVLFWRESSFQYIPGKTGWGQDHFFQFKKNSFFDIVYDRDTRTRRFDTIPRLLSVDVYDQANNANMYNGTFFEIDNQLLDYSMCGSAPALHVAVFDPVTLEPWGTYNCSLETANGTCNCTMINSNHQFGNENNGCYATSCRKRRENYFIFRQNNPAQMQAMRNMILDSVPDGHYILIYTAVKPEYQYWDDMTPSLTQTFQDLGANTIGQGPEKAFIFFYRKGDPSSAEEVVATLADNMHQKINLTVELDGFEFRGQENSVIIGPAANWETLYWKQDPSELNSADSTMLTIQAMNFNGTVELTIDTLFTHKDSIIQLNNLIQASQYPYIKLSASYKDSVTLTPAQIDRWHVLYQPVPEAAIDGSNMYTWTPIADTLFEGQDVTFAVDVKNISNYHMDSLLITYWIEDVDRNKHFIPYPRQDSLRVTDVIRDTITFSTTGLGGINSLWMEVNPYINGTLVTDQLEQHHFNNLLQVPFFVDADDVNPILDVTFDGIHILNGDIIAPESELLISLKDDNEWLVMDSVSDTTLFGIYITYPDGIQKRIPFIDGSGNTVMQWIPAEAQNKRFKIVYPALFEQDGKYTLLVQGSDRSGNLSGDMEYRITFEVIHESSITYLMNYPNPFSTSTRFVFTLTGSEVPDEMIIQIMTITGKVVREITEDEFGPIHIGRNISEFSWNGTDEFGDPLANGVYLYRVLSEIKGEEIKHRESGSDQYFKKEFGKMYLMR